MNNRITLQQPYQLRYEEDIPGIRVTWSAALTSRQLKEGLEEVLHLLEQHRVCKILWDLRALQPMGIEDQHWIKQHWLKRAVQLGYQAGAGLVPQDVVMYLTNEQFRRQADELGVLIRSFGTVEQAKTWLSSV